MSTLYLTEDGATLQLKDNRLVIRKTEETLKEISIEKVDNIVLVGRTHLSTPLATELLEREIPVSWLSSTGKFYGRLEPTTAINIQRQREQFRKSDDEKFSHELAKQIVLAFHLIKRFEISCLGFSGSRFFRDSTAEAGASVVPPKNSCSRVSQTICSLYRKSAISK